MKTLIRLCAAFAICVVSWGATEAQMPRPKGLVSFTFDDASLSQRNPGLSIAKSWNLVGTLFVATKNIADESCGDSCWGMSWSHVREFIDAGWTIGCHTHTHRRLTTLADEEVDEEMRRCRMHIIEETGVEPVSFASPEGYFDDRVLAHVRRYFANHFKAWESTVTEAGINHLSRIDAYRISRLEVKPSDNMLKLCSKIGLRAREGYWTVLYFHEFKETAAPFGADRFSLSPVAFNELAACVASLRDKGALEVVTVEEALSRRPPPRQPQIARKKGKAQ